MYNIAVLVHSFSIEYANLIIKGIYNYFENSPDVRVFFAQTSHPHFNGNEFDYQYWASCNYLKSKCIDEVIVVSNTYTVFKNQKELQKLFKPFFTKNLISIGLKLDDKKTYHVIARSSKSYDEVVNHLKNIHHCSKIAFYSANLLQSAEAEDRYQAFINALKKNGLEFNPDWVFDGNFTTHNVQETLRKKYSNKSEIPFDAIICANDMMGMEVLSFFSSIGMKVPEEMKVFGLDNTYHSILSVPTLATIDQDIEGIGKAVAEFGLNIIKDKKKSLPHTLETSMKVIYRRSCGCEDLVEQKKHDVFYGILNREREFHKLTNIFDLIQGTSTMEDFANAFSSIVKYSGFSAMSVFAFKEPLAFQKDDNITLPKEARLILKIDTETDVARYYENNEFFDTTKDLFGKEGLDKTAGRFILQPLFLHELQYGYLICKVNFTDFSLNHLLLKIITSVVIQAYEYTKKMNLQLKLEKANKKLKEKTTELNLKSKTDELTGLLNRRGFYEQGEKLIHFSSNMDNNGVVFFADLDGLKTINDKFGHGFGDQAIQTESKILKKSFRKMDVLGRLSGDEFGIVVSGMDINQVDSIRAKIDDLNEKYTKDNNLPFKLSISLGAAAFNSQKSDLNALLKEADKNLYEQKEIHHAKMAQN